MTPKQFWHSSKAAEIKRVASEAKTNVANFKHIALYRGACSADLARRLADASNGAMTLEDILFRHERDEDTTAA